MTKKLKQLYESSRSIGTWENYQNMQTKKAKAIQKAKTLHFKESVHEAGSSLKRIWTLATWAKNYSQTPKAIPVFPAMRLTSNCTAKTISFKGKIQILKERFFPPPQKANLEDIISAYYPTPWQLSMIITPEEVKAAVQHLKPDKTSRINRIPSRFLNQILKVFLPEFMCLFQACINLGYHFKEF